MSKTLKFSLVVGACAVFAAAPLVWMVAIVLGKFR